MGLRLRCARRASSAGAQNILGPLPARSPVGRFVSLWAPWSSDLRGLQQGRVFSRDPQGFGIQLGKECDASGRGLPHRYDPTLTRRVSYSECASDASSLRIALGAVEVMARLV
jgi:hypothetical protein